MAHGLTKFDAQRLLEKSHGVNVFLEELLEQRKGANLDALMEAVKVILENQIEIIETLELIKKEFDKFEEGLSKIL